MSLVKTTSFVSLFVLVTLLFGTLEAYAQGERVMRSEPLPVSQNSQTMTLLEIRHSLAFGNTGGAELTVVDDSALVAETHVVDGDAAELAVVNNGQISTYVVREGDTLSDIAKMFGVSVNTISWANDLRGSRIAPGQTLVILPISGVKHVVAKGDTLQSIAKKYKADYGEVLAYNGFTSSTKISVGDTVIVPDGEISSSVAPTLTYTASNTQAPSGYYGRPIQGGRRTQGLHGRNGIDLGAPIGTPVLASADGTVLTALGSGYNGGYGLYVVIRHPNGTQTLYAHLSQVNVTAGDRVSKGEVIGRVGNTGRSTGPHLHFEIRGARNPF